mmetsp:Transcript_26324/g.81985  ORF Transcript_26324/g.81985 Transcript_26324/m.81985 type:complete len:464 (-) Transcript_26324:213-1604(-)
MRFLARAATGARRPLATRALVEDFAEFGDFTENPKPSPEVPPDAPAEEQPVGMREDERYDCGPSVKEWRNHDAGASAARIAQQIQSRPDSALPYYAYHGLKTTAFAAQGLLSIMLTGLAANATNRATPAAGAFLSRVIEKLPDTARGLGSEVVGALADDFDYISTGQYRQPWDMAPSHRQNSPVFALRKSAMYMDEAMQTLLRRAKSSAGEEVDTETWLQSPAFPHYYGKTYHFQTDGWLSQFSADVYETSTETLFLGRQDAMQRMTMLPMQSWRAEYGTSGNGEDLSVAEFACGTGRVATFVRDNMPGADFTLLDLSPFYLATARDNHAYYERFVGRSKATGKVNFLQANAEASGLPDNAFNIVYCVYAFHELPPEGRAAVAAEMVRVCAPGGVVVLTDSHQLGDRPEYAATIGNFEDFNEPYYASFIEQDLGALFEDAGAVPYQKHVNSVTKTLSFLKPEA